MKTISRVALIAVACASASACTPHDNSLDASDPEAGVADNLTVVPEQCSMVTSIEVVHRVNGRVVTDRLRLTEEAGEDAAMALRSFQVAANYFGAANVISSRPINQVHCFPQAAAATAPVAKFAASQSGSSLCVDWNGVLDCTPVTPSHTYDYPATENCDVTNHTEAVSFSCADSSAIVTRHGDVVLTINTDNLRNDVLARTQALRRLVGDANVITNFHFDIVVTPDQRASIVGNDAYNNISQQIKLASDTGQPLPDIQQILQNLPQPPENVEFYTQLQRAHQIKVERLQLLAQITSGALLSPQQVNAFYQSFITKSRLVDQLDVENSASSLSQAAAIINDTIGQLATTEPSSTVYNQVKAGAQSLLEAHTSKGVFDPGQTLDFVVPDLYESLTDADIEKRLVASEMQIEFNEAIRGERGKERAAAMAGPIGLLALALANDDMERVWRLYDQVQATEFFFDNSDPAGTSYDVHLTPDAQAMFNIQAEPNSAIAYEVINLLNETADYNAQTGRVTIDFKAIITINARQALSVNDIKRALYHTEASYGVLNFLKTGGSAFLGGMLKELGGTVTGVFYTAAAILTDPGAFVDHLKSAVVNWRQTLDIVLQQGIDVIHRWPNMTLEEKSELLGRIATQVLLSLPAEARQAGRLNEAVEDAVRLHLDKAGRGLAIIERGGVALTEEAAVELVKRLERYEVLAIEDAVKVADALDDALPCNIVSSSRLQLHAAGIKPPCGVTQIASAFEQLAVSAQRKGFTKVEDLSDIMKSKSLSLGLIENKMDVKEVAFAKQILQKEGGTMIGNRVQNRKAIDGFFNGGAMQLKTQETPKMSAVKNAIRDTQIKASEEGFKEVRMFQKLTNLTKEEALAYILDPSKPMLTIPKVGGTIRSIDLLTSDGFWLHIEGGVVR
jgi:DNA-binding transcriptional MerR regulator